MSYPPPYRASHARRGFTLMEILAAVAIVSVLVAITLKVGNEAKLSSASVKCMSNMRQIGMAINSYAADNDNNYPPIVVSTQGWKYWDMELIWPYATGLSSSSAVNYFTTYKGSVFQCPASDPKKTCSYGMNAMFPDGIKITISLASAIPSQNPLRACCLEKAPTISSTPGGTPRQDSR